MLTISNLHVSVDGKEILKGLNLDLPDGEVHAIMGPNGSGKSTLANALAGHPGFDVTEGSVMFRGENLLDLKPEVRAAKGLFLGFQHPVEIPGVSNMNFLRTALNSIRRYNGEEEMDAGEFLKLLRAKASALGLSNEMMKRAVNVGFSGGERKRNEMVQLAVLNPRLAVLDETDSGLDIDALKIVADGINDFSQPDRALLVITHYKRLLEYVKPDVIHVLQDGRIVRSGGKELADELEKKGYASVA